MGDMIPIHLVNPRAVEWLAGPIQRRNMCVISVVSSRGGRGAGPRCDALCAVHWVLFVCPGFPALANSIILSRAIISKSIAHLNDQTVAALGMQALMKTEYVFGKPASGASTRNDLAFKSVRPFDFSVAAALIHGNNVPQLLFHVTSTDIYVGPVRRSHVS